MSGFILRFLRRYRRRFWLEKLRLYSPRIAAKQAAPAAIVYAPAAMQCQPYERYAQRAPGG